MNNQTYEEKEGFIIVQQKSQFSKNNKQVVDDLLFQILDWLKEVILNKKASKAETDLNMIKNRFFMLVLMLIQSFNAFDKETRNSLFEILKQLQVFDQNQEEEIIGFSESESNDNFVYEEGKGENEEYYEETQLFDISNLTQINDLMKALESNKLNQITQIAGQLIERAGQLQIEFKEIKFQESQDKKLYIKNLKLADKEWLRDQYTISKHITLARRLIPVLKNQKMKKHMKSIKRKLNVKCSLWIELLNMYESQKSQKISPQQISKCLIKANQFFLLVDQIDSLKWKILETYHNHSFTNSFDIHYVFKTLQDVSKIKQEYSQFIWEIFDNIENLEDKKLMTTFNLRFEQTKKQLEKYQTDFLNWCQLNKKEEKEDKNLSKKRQKNALKWKQTFYYKKALKIAQLRSKLKRKKHLEVQMGKRNKK